VNRKRVGQGLLKLGPLPPRIAPQQKARRNTRNKAAAVAFECLISGQRKRPRPAPDGACFFMGEASRDKQTVTRR
jgi:hypothetical protein